MARDHSLLLRRAIVTRLRADADLTALVPDERVYGERSPAALTWPFTRYGTSEAVPEKAQCWDGARVTFPIHSFSKSDFTDEVAEINAAVAASLDNETIELSPSSKAYVRWVGSMIIPDAAESGAYHGIARFEATIA